MENVPCATGKNVYSVAFGWNVLYVAIKSLWFDALFKASVSLLIFCLGDLFTDVSGMLKYPTIIVLLSFSPFMSVSIHFMYSGAPILGA